ncbi:DUF1192 domain-containing protein [Bauldia litoralis]|uniref:Uncharacterized small protein, DUF1192 family n=1 Tax=Bauldia litoralis TaxID=665467 RepID=A0A1G6A2Z1_9HYPH|nr:DUF1192 domain-containing protein [Bauldia litoralis]SDB02808.1 Uncharacterized small protein, DUF1192 family [Bauldia litoralis]
MTMPEDSAPPKKPAGHIVGEDLATLSLDELAERVVLLREEVTRIEAAIEAKRASADAAASFFKK